MYMHIYNIYIYINKNTYIHIKKNYTKMQIADYE